MARRILVNDRVVAKMDVAGELKAVEDGYHELRVS